eukprot:361271-Chlamydomonas_euryale.AAC.7
MPLVSCVLHYVQVLHPVLHHVGALHHVGVKSMRKLSYRRGWLDVSACVCREGGGTSRKHRNARHHKRCRCGQHLNTCDVRSGALNGAAWTPVHETAARPVPARGVPYCRTPST